MQPSRLLTWPGAIGRAGLAVVGDFGRLTCTAWEASRRLARAMTGRERFRASATVRQIYLMGASGVPIVCLIAGMMGLTLAFQSAYQLERLGAEQYVANLVAVALTRELGPVITAIVVAGRTGSAIAAEIASMKVEEELDALEVMGLKPISFLVSPKLLAMLIAMPLLTALADVVGILGGLFCATAALGIPAHQYLHNTQEALLMRDFVSGLMKAGIFAVIIVAVATHCGFEVRGGAEGIGRATTRAVVLSIFLVILADLVFTGIFYNWSS